jgi:hypothetical protein
MSWQYLQRLTVAISANQAAGTEPILPRNKHRAALLFIAEKDFKISLADAGVIGMPILATLGHSLGGDYCPQNPIYLVSGSGIVAGDSLMIWEA